jgi:hypothetical protein
MDLLKTPHQMLLEEAGAKIPTSTEMLKTPQQMLMEQTGLPQKFAPGGKVGTLANLAKFLEGSKTPQRLYHGTTASEEKGAKALSQLRQSKEGSLGAGIYMTPKPEFASEYATQAGGYVMPVHANLNNPLVIHSTMGPGGNGDPMMLALTQLGVTPEKAEKIIEKAYDTRGYIGKEVMSRAQKQGYDGITQYKDGDLSEVVSFSPYGIKSATGNTGEYAPWSPELSKADGGLINQPRMSPQDMIADIMAQGQTPQKFASGSTVKNIAGQSAFALPFIPEEARNIAQDIKSEKYPEAAVRTAGVGYSAFAPFNPLTMGTSLVGYSPEVGDATLEGWKKQELERQMMEQYKAKLKADQLQKIKETRFYKK